MTFLDRYHEDSGTLRVSRQQASDFAKQVADDFNPLHDADAKPFCVPGDLLFALVLHRYGLSQQMHFTFKGMVGEGVDLIFPDAQREKDASVLTIADSQGKEYLSIERSGRTTRDDALVEEFTRRYVKFSGQTFPHILVPLMAEHSVMINPQRPLVIYASMSIHMERLDIVRPQLELTHSSLHVEGKRGSVALEFTITAEGNVVGKGEKSLVLSGLRAFEQDDIDQLVNHYSERKLAYLA